MSRAGGLNKGKSCASVRSFIRLPLPLPEGIENVLGAEKFDDPLSEAIWIFELALPNGERAPSLPAELGDRAPVTSHVAFQLSPPKSDPRFRHAVTIRTRVLMPEATVNEDDATTASEHEIGRTRELSAV
jgi:hypothetical protein